eukprot:762890-Hanusia_phi.AAC.6
MQNPSPAHVSTGTSLPTGASSTALRERRIFPFWSRRARTLTSIFPPTLKRDSTLSMRSLSSSDTWTSPSLPGHSSTKQPNGCTPTARRSEREKETLAHLAHLRVSHFLLQRRGGGGREVVGLLCKKADLVLSLGHALGVEGGDRYDALRLVLDDVDVDKAELLDQAPDRRPAGPNDLADRDQRHAETHELRH